MLTCTVNICKQRLIAGQNLIGAKGTRICICLCAKNPLSLAYASICFVSGLNDAVSLIKGVIDVYISIADENYRLIDFFLKFIKIQISRKNKYI